MGELSDMGRYELFKDEGNISQALLYLLVVIQTDFSLFFELTVVEVLNYCQELEVIFLPLWKNLTEEVFTAPGEGYYNRGYY